MKFSFTEVSGNVIRSYEPGRIQVNGIVYSESLILTVDTATAWPVADMASLTPDHLAALLAHGPDLVLLGTGERQQFPAPRLCRPLAEAGVGLEVMTTAAAARTFNVLVAEDRRVVAALIV